jgi:hypothetical protein
VKKDIKNRQNKYSETEKKYLWEDGIGGTGFVIACSCGNI